MGKKIITVDNEGDGPYPKYFKINDAIKNANNGDEIWVYSGTYNEEVKILADDSRLLRLKGIPEELENGTDTGKPIISPKVSTGNAVTIKENECYISGFDIRNPLASGNKSGIYLEGSSNTIIGDMNISESPQGIYLYNSANNGITENNITDNGRFGILLSSSPHNSIYGNFFKSNGIIIKGDDLEDWNTHIIENNNIDGKPIYYYKDENNKVLPSNAGQVIFANCRDCDVKDLIISSVDTSIQLGFCHRNVISENTITDNSYNAIYLSNSYNNSISENEIINNKYDGISLSNSYDNSVFNNNISNSLFDGIYLHNSYDNRIYQNVLTYNDDDGIHLMKSNANEIFYNHIKGNNRGLNSITSNNNIIYNNTFLENKNQQGDFQNANDNGTNIWNLSKGGNYWDDYIIYYPDPKDTDNDGCWDDPYPIYTQPPLPIVKNWDKHPFSKPFKNEPPNTPEISGKRFGKIGEQYDYKIDTLEPNLDYITYYIEWGDGDNDSFGPIKPPDYKATATHTWTTKGLYKIKVKAIDKFGAESNTGILTVYIITPRNKPIVFNFNILSWFSEHFPLLERLLILIRVI